MTHRRIDVHVPPDDTAWPGAQRITAADGRALRSSSTEDALHLTDAHDIAAALLRRLTKPSA